MLKRPVLVSEYRPRCPLARFSRQPWRSVWIVTCGRVSFDYGLFVVAGILGLDGSSRVCRDSRPVLSQERLGGGLRSDHLRHRAVRGT
jgi:hypothetical protein